MQGRARAWRRSRLREAHKIAFCAFLKKRLEFFVSSAWSSGHLISFTQRRSPDQPRQLTGRGPCILFLVRCILHKTCGNGGAMRSGGALFSAPDGQSRGPAFSFSGYAQNHTARTETSHHGSRVAVRTSSPGPFSCSVACAGVETNLAHLICITKGNRDALCTWIETGRESGPIRARG